MAGKRYNDLVNMQKNHYGSYSAKARSVAKEHSANMKELNKIAAKRKRNQVRNARKAANKAGKVVRHESDPSTPRYVMWF